MPVRIRLDNTGKRYNLDWIFRQVSLALNAPGHYAITGPNGSGKSTLLQVIGGAILPTEGSIHYELNGKNIDSNDLYSYSSIVAPYLELIEEMTATEFLQFHHSFKNLNASIENILSEVNLLQAANKQIRYFSSGMKQRLKLAQAFFCNSPLLLIDEPTTNLDAEGILIYEKLLNEHTCLLYTSPSPRD